MTLKSIALLLAGAVALSGLTGCNETKYPKGEGQNRYQFANQVDKNGAEMIKIFDTQTGDYWIKRIATDVKAGKNFAIWMHVPLKATPASGVAELPEMAKTSEEAVDEAKAEKKKKKSDGE